MDDWLSPSEGKILYRQGSSSYRIASRFLAEHYVCGFAAVPLCSEMQIAVRVGASRSKQGLTPRRVSKLLILAAALTAACLLPNHNARGTCEPLQKSEFTHPTCRQSTDSRHLLFKSAEANKGTSSSAQLCFIFPLTSQDTQRDMSRSLSKAA